MYTRMIHPKALSSEELDVFPAQGWFRMRQAMFTCNCHERRILRNVDPVSDGGVPLSKEPPPSPSTQRRKVRAEHRSRVDHARDGRLLRSIATTAAVIWPRPPERVVRRRRRGHLRHPVPRSATRGRLVACSFFDGRQHGEHRGYLRPRAPQIRLGFYTMLAEMRLGIESGLSCTTRVAPGCSAFDYKPDWAKRNTSTPSWCSGVPTKNSTCPSSPPPSSRRRSKPWSPRRPRPGWRPIYGCIPLWRRRHGPSW